MNHLDARKNSLYAYMTVNSTQFNNIKINNY